MNINISYIIIALCFFVCIYNIIVNRNNYFAIFSQICSFFISIAILMYLLRLPIISQTTVGLIILLVLLSSQVASIIRMFTM